MERIKRLYAEGFGKGQIPQPSVAFVHRVLPGLHVAVGTRQGTEEGAVFPSVAAHAPLLSPVQVRLALFAQVLKIRRRWVQDRRYERRWTPVFAFWKGERHVRGDNEQPFSALDQWKTNKKRITRLLADNNLASRAKKKKKMTTTHLDAYQRLCKQLFPAKVLLGHKLVDVLEKVSFQKKRNGRAVRGYRYSWNQKAIEQVCKMVESSRK